MISSTVCAEARGAAVVTATTAIRNVTATRRLRAMLALSVAKCIGRLEGLKAGRLEVRAFLGGQGWLGVDGCTIEDSSATTSSFGVTSRWRTWEGWLHAGPRASMVAMTCPA